MLGLFLALYQVSALGSSHTFTVTILLTVQISEVAFQNTLPNDTQVYMDWVGKREDYIICPACNSVHYSTRWWFNQQAELPSWAEACKLVLLVQPLSAIICSSGEGLFFVRKLISHQQRCSLEDCFFVSNVAVQLLLIFVKIIWILLRIMNVLKSHMNAC